ncbi:hypothetical protein [Paenibacillus solanacearum]|uniref:hypothetical protein n=1 Tax=Paenibacillus solanacearum TaxID=2048548 RepID=UPI001C403D1F|nr:hypothetical protein [Paenibacillus solanacearum]
MENLDYFGASSQAGFSPSSGPNRDMKLRLFFYLIPNIAGFDIIKISLGHAGCGDADPLQHVGAKE